MKYEFGKVYLEEWQDLCQLDFGSNFSSCRPGIFLIREIFVINYIQNYSRVTKYSVNYIIMKGTETLCTLKSIVAKLPKNIEKIKPSP